MHAHSTRRKQHFFSTYVYREREHGWYTPFLRSCVSLGRINSVQSANNATVQLNCIYRADIPTDIRVFASLLSNGHWFFARSRDCVPTMEKEGKKKNNKNVPRVPFAMVRSFLVPLLPFFVLFFTSLRRVFVAHNFCLISLSINKWFVWLISENGVYGRTRATC